MRVLYDEEIIEGRVRELGAVISRDYDDGNKELLIVGILNGCCMFMAELMKRIEVPFQVKFINGAVDGAIYVYENIYNNRVLLVDGVCDTGKTLYTVKSTFGDGGCDVKTCVLIDKIQCRKINMRVNYAGFIMKGEKFVVGYGMDNDGLDRGLPYIMTR